MPLRKATVQGAMFKRFQTDITPDLQAANTRHTAQRPFEK